MLVYQRRALYTFLLIARGIAACAVAGGDDGVDDGTRIVTFKLGVKIVSHRTPCVIGQSL